MRCSAVGSKNSKTGISAADRLGAHGKRPAGTSWLSRWMRVYLSRIKAGELRAAIEIDRPARRG